eukprot:Anaeramoba_ignava/a482563_30.p1 GENE.a482563_30~~a482563_30.p1  ORF type:complete len:373 (+),score=134.91 a482563_30:1092-2210(+)
MNDKVQREIRMLKIFWHPHIIRLYEVLETKHRLFFVLEYACGGELFDYILGRGKLQEDQARKFFKQILEGVEYCHNLNIAHRDIKPENLLLDRNGNLKIIDFGFANFLSPPNLCKTYCGSPSYSAPELIMGQQYSGSKVDIWSIGVVLYCLLCGKLPFLGESPKEICRKIVAGEYKIPTNVSSEAQDLIKRILEKNVDKRLTMEEIKKHKWVNMESFTQTPLPEINNSSQDEIDFEIIHKMNNWNISSESIIESLKSKKFNSITATYFLLQDSKSNLIEIEILHKNQKSRELKGFAKWRKARKEKKEKEKERKKRREKQKKKKGKKEEDTKRKERKEKKKKGKKRKEREMEKKMREGKKKRPDEKKARSKAR